MKLPRLVVTGLFCLSMILLGSVAVVSSPTHGQTSGGALPRPAEQPASASVKGETLDPSTYGPSVVETMEAVTAREQEHGDKDADEGENEKENQGRGDQHGKWIVPEREGTFRPHSGIHDVVNEWGDTLMGIGFPGPVNVQGAWFAGQAAQGAWTKGIRVTGFRLGKKVGVTEWFHDIGSESKFFDMNLRGVDRIEIEATAVLEGAGWYAMDDLTYTPVAVRGEKAQQVVIDFEDCRFDQELTGANYKGLQWEAGKGEFKVDHAIPGPERRGDRDNLPPAPAPEGGVAGGGGTAPNLVQNFQGVIRGDAGQQSFPPDTCGAVGPNHFVEVVNTNYSVYLKSTGVRVVNNSLGAFLPGGSGDGRVLYDQYSGRWIVVDSDFNTRIFIAVSTTNDPTGSYFKTSFIASAGVDSGFFPDYPTLGVDVNGIYVAAAFNSMTIFAIDKAPLIAGAPSLGTVTAFRSLNFDGAIQPVHTYGTPATAGEICISTTSPSSGSALRMRRIVPPLTAPTLSGLSNVSVSAYSAAPDAPAMGSGTALDTIDDRLMNAVFRDGFVWAAHTINVGGRAAVRWYKVNITTLTQADSGTIDDPVRYYFFPSLMVNMFGDMVIGFTGSSSTEFASCYYSGRSATDTAGQTGPPALLKAGVSSYNLNDNVGRNRWGDYSLTSLDPTDEASLWTIQEYAAGSSTWGTWIGKLSITQLPANNDCANATIVGTGTFPFSTLNATTDGPTETSCLAGGYNTVGADIWYRFAAQCTGTATISVCDATFNTKIMIYTSGCPAGPNTAIACNDDFCGTRSQVTFPVVTGTLYRVRLGGFFATSGTGNMIITCTPSAPPCPADVALPHNGFVNVDDLLAVINSWGPCAGCPADIAPPGGNGAVNVDDLLAVINAWGPCP